VCIHPLRAVTLSLQLLAPTLHYRKAEQEHYGEFDEIVIFLEVFCEAVRGTMAPMKRNLGRRVVLLSGMLTASVTIGQIVTANPLTVPEAVSEALKNNPELRGLSADMTAAKGGGTHSANVPQPRTDNRAGRTTNTGHRRLT
jgi:hypothetical protein